MERTMKALPLSFSFSALTGQADSNSEKSKDDLKYFWHGCHLESEIQLLLAHTC